MLSQVPVVLPVASLLLLVTAAILALIEKPVQNGIGLLFAASGLVVYWLGVSWRNKPAHYHTLMGEYTQAWVRGYWCTGEG